MSEKLMTVQDLAELLSVPVSTVYRWNYRGTGPRPYKVGKHARYHRADVDRWLERQATERASA